MVKNDGVAHLLNTSKDDIKTRFLFLSSTLKIKTVTNEN